MSHRNASSKKPSNNAQRGAGGGNQQNKPKQQAHKHTASPIAGVHMYTREAIRDQLFIIKNNEKLKSSIGAQYGVTAQVVFLDKSYEEIDPPPTLSSNQTDGGGSVDLQTPTVRGAHGTRSQADATRATSSGTERSPEEKSLMIAWQKDARQAKNDLIKIAFALQTTLSEEVHDCLLRNSVRFKSGVETSNPRLIYKAMDLDMYSSVTQIPNREEEEYAARQSFHKLKQGSNELLDAFYKRYREVYKRAKERGLQEMSEKNLARDFIHKLDESRFAQFKCEISNDEMKPGGAESYPASIEVAYHMASMHKKVVLSSKEGQKEHLLSFALSKNTTKKQDGKSNTDGKRTQNQSSSSNPSNFSNQAIKPGCGLCGENDHMMFKCPFKERAEKYVKEMRANKKAFVTERSQDDNAQDENFDEGFSHSVYTILKVNTRDKRVDKNQIILDTGSEVSVYFNAELLENIRECPEVRFSGVGKGTLVTNKIGDIKDMKVW